MIQIITKMVIIKTYYLTQSLCLQCMSARTNKVDQEKGKDDIFSLTFSSQQLVGIYFTSKVTNFAEKKINPTSYGILDSDAAIWGCGDRGEIYFEHFF